jgi:enterochelin esterase-like enzyme
MNNEHGTPLIEAIPGDEAQMLVTFLWKDSGETRNVVVVGGPAPWGDFIKNQMIRLSQTDVWYKTYKARSDMRTMYWLSRNDSLVHYDDVEDWEERMATFQSDPFNLRPFETGSMLELSAAPSQPWIISKPKIPKGHVEEYHFASQLLHNQRRIWIYTPPGYAEDRNVYDLLVLLDGQDYLARIPAPTILDNLLHEEKLTPCVAVLVESLGARLQELCCSPTFVEFLTQELLPWVSGQASVTAHPAQTTIGGLSAGGLAAAFIGFKASERFGNILSQSGTFLWGPRLQASQFEDDSDAEWLIRQFVTTPRLPLRFYLEMGLLDKTHKINHLAANRHFRDVLEAKGYEIHYAEFNGGHDFLCWRGSLADGLLTLISRR